MEIWVAILLFFLNVGDDALAVLYIRRTAEGKAIQASLISVALTLIVAFSVVQYITNYLYLIPIAGGSGLGSYLAVKWDKAYRRKKYGKRKPKSPDLVQNMPIKTDQAIPIPKEK